MSAVDYVAQATIAYVEDFEFLREWFDSRTGEWDGPFYSGLDIETEGQLSPHDGEIATVQIELKGQCWVVHWRNDKTLATVPYVEFFRMYLESPKVTKIVHNMKFEVAWFTKAFGWDFRMQRPYDTMAAEYILAEGVGSEEEDEETGESNWFNKPDLSLDGIVEKRYGVVMDKDSVIRMGFRRKGNYHVHKPLKSGGVPACADCGESAQVRVGSTDVCDSCVEVGVDYRTKAGKPRARKPIDTDVFVGRRELKLDLSPRELAYAGNDALWAAKVAQDQIEEMTQLELEGENYLFLTELDSQTACTIARMELRGIPINREELECLDAEFQYRERILREDIESAVCFDAVIPFLEAQGEVVDYEQLPTRLGYFVEPSKDKKNKWRKACRLAKAAARDAGIEYVQPPKPEPKWYQAKDFPNLGASEQMKNRLIHMGYPLPSYESHELRHFADDPLIAKILEWKSIEKLQGTYTNGFLVRIKPATGRVHGGFNQFVTSTGRLSAIDPNLQNLPSKSADGLAVRLIVDAGPGRKFVIVDYSQIELRLIAEMYNDFAMQRAFNEGLDLHSFFAARMLGITYEEMEAGKKTIYKDARAQAKPANFGLGYGAGVKQFQHIAWSQYGLILSTEEATRIRALWLQTWSGVAAHHEKMKSDIKLGTGPMKFRTQDGRTRKLQREWTNKEGDRKTAYAAGLNHPIQGTGADGVKKAMIAIDPWLPENAFLLMQIHDELVCECDIQDAEAVLELMSKLMVDAMQPYLKTVPCEVDGHITDRWTKG